MARILLVDDDPEKVRRVLQVVSTITGQSPEDTDIAHNAQEAKTRLKAIQYDLLILDIALPDRADTLPTTDGGIALLAEIAERPAYKKPREIIGLTAYPEVFLSASAKFAEELWHVIQFDTSSESWATQLKRKIKYIQMSLQNRPGSRHGCDLCIVTALPIPEFKALSDLPWAWHDLDVDEEVVAFKEGSFSAGGASRRVIAACAGSMGMIASAVLATKMLYNFHPRYLAMTGIAAGFRGKCGLGDILVADPTWDYDSGKWEAASTGKAFRPAPYQVSLHALLRSRLQQMSQNQVTLDEIRRTWKGPTPDTALQMHIAPLASGASVRADGSVVSEVLEQHRKTLGLEMEAYGVMVAAHEAPLPDVKAFVIKSVSDFADDQKSDSFQAYAAYTSASALRIFAEQYLPL
jgi:nucleoside phosphorylase